MPIVLILHVIGAGIFVGGITTAAYVTFRSPLTSERIQLLKPLQVIVPLATYFLLATGLYLFFSNFEHFVYSEYFWAKMSLFAANGLLATFILMRRVEADLAQGQVEIKNNLRNGFLLQAVLAFMMVALAVLIGESH